MANFVIYKIASVCFKITYNESAILSIAVVLDSYEQGSANEFTEKVRIQLEEYFAGERRKFDFPYQLIGTEFQQKVWSALCQIPYGETRTYQEIASMVGNPKAARAVGMANNKNPLLIVVPCHRVIGANGKLTGYAGGLGLKEQLLNIEK